GGSPIPLTGLGTDYQMYALFSGGGTTSANAIGGVDGVFDAFNVTFFVDTAMDTGLALVGGNITTTGGIGDDIAVLSGVLGLNNGGFHVFPGLAAGDFHVQFDATA